MDSESAHMVVASKEVIENGNSTPKTTVVECVEKVIPFTIVEEKAQKRLEVNARRTLMMGFPNEHQLKFNLIKDAKSLLEAIEKRFGETLDQTFDRLQKLVSQLEILGENISQEDVNQKLLRSLSLEWNTHAVVWRNKPELETMSMDDLYNNIKVYEPEVKGISSSSTNIQNAAFVSSNSTNSTNGAVNTAYGATSVSTQATIVDSTIIDNLSDAIIYAFFTSQLNNPQLDNEDLQQINPDDLEEMDLRGAPRNQYYKNKESTKRIVPVETSTSTTLVSCDGVGGYDWSDQAEEGPTNYALMANSSLSSNFEVYRDMTIGELRNKLEIVQKEKDGIQFNVDKLENAFKSLNKIIESQIIDNCKKGLGYNAVPPSLIGNL
ncbi:hypothetical protein Tco_1260205 [Tanacetum coccineum]